MSNVSKMYITLFIQSHLLLSKRNSFASARDAYAPIAPHRTGLPVEWMVRRGRSLFGHVLRLSPYGPPNLPLLSISNRTWLHSEPLEYICLKARLVTITFTETYVDCNTHLLINDAHRVLEES